MQIKPAKTMLIVLLPVLMNAACNKSNDSEAGENTTYLTSSAWRLKAFRYDMGPDGKDDYVYAPDSCEADDSYAFAKDNALIFDPGAVICGKAETAMSTTWALGNNGTRLSFGGSAYNIKTINDTLMTLYYDTTETNMRYRAFIDFKH
ncbi:MAG: hypothetical protein JST39_05025 [Bacteroidetes bacterium]|nr:hypothetical protein [Bacteroidota bacterium]